MGADLSADAHLAQSISDILSTPIGTRVMRRAYGSDLPALIDTPISPATAIDLYQAVAEALDEWEPRIALERVQIDEARAGYARLIVTVAGTDYDVEVAA